MTQVKTRTRPGPKPMNLDKRRVLLLRSQGISCYAIAKRFGVSTNVIWRAVKRWQEDAAREKQDGGA